MSDNSKGFLKRLKTAAIITLLLIACQQVSQNKSDYSLVSRLTTAFSSIAGDILT